MSSSWLSFLPCYDILATRMAALPWAAQLAQQEPTGHLDSTMAAMLTVPCESKSEASNARSASPAAAQAHAPTAASMQPPAPAEPETAPAVPESAPAEPERAPSPSAPLTWEEGAAIVEAAARKSASKVQVADDDDEVAWFVNMRLREHADPWPEDAPLPPESDEEALDSAGRWSAEACGVEVRACADDEAKGLGAFALRPMASGDVVGVYWGEVLTQREQALRHGWRSGLAISDATREEKAALAARAKRLAELTHGAPVHGVSNGSSYCFSLLPEEVTAALGSAFLPKHAAYIDGEDPTRSSWGRFVNHCSEAASGCNLVPRVDGMRQLVWFESKRDIEAGEELCFDYGASYRWDVPGTQGGPVRKSCAARPTGR